MRAVQLRAPKKPELVHVAVREPGPAEVRIAVRACGICGSDLHIIDGHVPTADLPLILGHEAAGVIDKMGLGGGSDMAVGDRVLINPIVVCGECTACRSGRTNQCPRKIVLGLGADGAAADYVIAPIGNVHKVPPSIDFATAAIMADAVAGPFHAIRAAGVRKGDTVAVFGLGGLGLHAVMILKQVVGARVIGVDTYDAALDRAPRFGVDVVVDAREGLPNKRIVDETGGGVAMSFEFVGSNTTVEQAIRSLRPGGLCTVVGVSPEKLKFGFALNALVANEWAVRGSYGYVPQDLDDLIDLVGSGQLTIDGTITHRVSLGDYNGGIATLRDRSRNPIRVVVENG